MLFEHLYRHGDHHFFIDAFRVPARGSAAERFLQKGRPGRWNHHAFPRIEFMPEAPYERSNCWLTVILINPQEFGVDREAVRLALEKENIESRPIWKPMHMHPYSK
jgi:dTDP-4-amino-4,6-dideoxygalactose transaminase